MAPNTSKKSWGGPWTEDKLEAFEEYVKAYLTVMKDYREKYNWKLCYFDGFAGNGTRSEEEITEEIAVMADLFGEEVTPEELYVYRGAAERVVRIEEQGIKGFDVFFFIDKDKKNCDALKEHLNQYTFSGTPYFHDWDANKALQSLSKWMTAQYGRKALVLLDPFGMQIDWSSIEALKGLDVDLWILIPSGVIVNRLLRRNFSEEKGFLHPEKLKSFFGLSEEELKQEFYTEVKEPSLFGGENTKNVKLADPIKRIAELYVKQLRQVFQQVTEPLVLESYNGRPLFHFVFASNNATGKKIAQYIINKKKA